MNDKFVKGDIVELLNYDTFSTELDQTIPLFGIVYSVPHGEYNIYNVYCKDLTPNHYLDDLVICNESELR